MELQMPYALSRMNPERQITDVDQKMVSLRKNQILYIAYSFDFFLSSCVVK